MSLLINCKKDGITKNCQELKYAGIVDDFNFNEDIAWANYDTYEEKLMACQIPKKVLQEMCTIGLITTCLNYPFWSDVFAFNNVQLGYNLLIRDNFNGIQELYKRDDGGIELLEMYTKIDPGGYYESWSSIELGDFCWRIIYLEFIIAQKEIILTLSKEQKLFLLKETLKKYEIKFNHITIYHIPGLVSSAYILAQLMIEMDYPPFINAINNDQELQYFTETSNFQNNSNSINELNKIILFSNQLINLNNQ